MRWAEEPGHPHLAELITEKHLNTWCSQEYLKGAISMDTGTTTGTSLADMVFSAAMAAVLRQFRRELVTEGLVFYIDTPHSDDPFFETEQQVREERQPSGPTK